MNMEIKEEWKQINDWAVATGKEMQSSQTGLIHYCYTALPKEPAQTIPVYENILFSLALMRSRTTDAVMEAKAILERMLAFQAEEGNFPIYIHEYPHSRDKFLGAYLLPPFYWILMQFHTVLGQDFTKRLEASARNLLRYTLDINATHECPAHIRALLAASSIALGKLWKDEKSVIVGEESLDSIPKDLKSNVWSSPIHVAHLLTALQMIYPSIAKSPWKHILISLTDSWHPTLAALIAPGMKELQWGLQPAATFFDLWMGYFTKIFSKRILQKQPFLLQGALIHSSEDIINFKSYPQRYESLIDGNRTLAQIDHNYAYTLYPHNQPLHPSADRGRRPFRLIWGNAQRLHTFVMEGGNIAFLEYQENGNEIALIATLNEPIGDDDREKKREITFFCDLHPELKTTISGKPGTVFTLNEPLLFESGPIRLQMTFSLLEGEGNFIGHLMRGNRPSQTADKGESRFAAFDQQIILRTLRRSHPCKIKIKIDR